MESPAAAFPAGCGCEGGGAVGDYNVIAEKSNLFVELLLLGFLCRTSLGGRRALAVLLFQFVVLFFWRCRREVGDSCLPLPGTRLLAGFRKVFDDMCILRPKWRGIPSLLMSRPPRAKT